MQPRAVSHTDSSETFGPVGGFSWPVDQNGQEFGATPAPTDASVPSRDQGRAS
jgi:hypothetical protein